MYESMFFESQKTLELHIENKTVSYCDKTSNAIAYVLYEIFWVKPDFTPEHFLNQTDLTRDEL